MENELLDRWVSGDPRAAGEIYRIYYRRAREFATTLGARLVDAEDIAQEALIAGLEGLRAGKRPDRFTHWLLGIARHVTFQKMKPRPGALTDVVDPRRRGGRTLAVRREMGDLLERTLQRLPPALREVVDLVHRAGLSRKEAADRLRLPLDAVHARCERAYARLRQALSRHFTTLAVRSLEPRAVRLEDIRALPAGIPGRGRGAPPGGPLRGRRGPQAGHPRGHAAGAPPERLRDPRGRRRRGLLRRPRGAPEGPVISR